MAARSLTGTGGPRSGRMASILGFLKRLGPGVITGAADDDPAGITTYAVVGASTGFSLLWLLVLSVPMLYAVEEMSARIGIVTKKHLQALILERFGVVAAAFCALLVTICNVTTIAADIAGIASGLAILTGLSFRWFVVPAGVLMGYLLLEHGYRAISRFLLLLTPLFFLYVVDAFLAKPDWTAVLSNTLIPHVSPSAAFLLAAVGLLGTTISPYLLFWQTAEEVETRTRVREMPSARFDVAVGMGFSNLISFFVIVCTAAVLYPHPHLRTIHSAAQAALALKPLAGNLSSALFAVGLIVVGALAVPVLTASTAYVVAATLKAPFGLDKKFKNAHRFYLVIFTALAAGALADFAGINVVQMLFYSQVLDGILMPFLIYFLIRLADDPQRMGNHRSQPAIRWIGWATLGVMGAFAAAGVYQLFAGG